MQVGTALSKIEPWYLLWTGLNYPNVTAEPLTSSACDVTESCVTSCGLEDMALLDGIGRGASSNRAEDRAVVEKEGRKNESDERVIAIT